MFTPVLLGLDWLHLIGLIGGPALGWFMSHQFRSSKLSAIQAFIDKAEKSKAGQEVLKILHDEYGITVPVAQQPPAPPAGK